jgi:hypothetical protein
MKHFITQLEVQTNNKKKRWIITRCDEDSEVVGTCTACGVPAKAEDMPVGTTFQTILAIP